MRYDKQCYCGEITKRNEIEDIQNAMKIEMNTMKGCCASDLHIVGLPLCTATIPFLNSDCATRTLSQKYHVRNTPTYAKSDTLQPTHQHF